MRWIVLITILLCPVFSYAQPTGLTYNEHVWILDGSLPARTTGQKRYEDVIHADNSEGWMMALWLGNFAARTLWHDGPRLEVGGMKRAGRATQGNGKMYFSYAPYNQDDKIIEVDETTGAARLFMDRYGTYTGPTDEAISGSPIYDPVNDILYLTGHYCLRKVVDDGDETRSVVVVAGQCGVEGAGDATDDGTGAAAKFGETSGWAVAHDGNIYHLEVDNIKKITPAGVVTTHSVTRPDGQSPLWNGVGGGDELLSAGENANTLYINDTYGAAGNALWKLDLTTHTMSHVAGVLKANDPYNRHGKESDGPATTLTGVAGGFRSLYNPFYGTVFTRGQDNIYLHKLTADGWLKTVLFYHRKGDPWNTYTADMMQSGNYYNPSWANLKRLSSIGHIIAQTGHDDRGGLYIWHATGELSTFWRAYNSLEGGTE